MAYCTPTQLGYSMSSNRRDRLADDDADGSAETGVLDFICDGASDIIYSIIRNNADISADSTYAPATYVAGAYPVLDFQATQLGAVLLRERRGVGEFIWSADPTIQWCYAVQAGEISI